MAKQSAKKNKKKQQIKIGERNFASVMQAGMFAIGLVHLGYLFLLTWAGCFRLALFNIISIICYYICYRLLQNYKNVVIVYRIILIEIITFIVLTSWSISGRLWFSLIIIGIAPFTGLVNFIIKSLNLNKKFDVTFYFIVVSAALVITISKELFVWGHGPYVITGLPQKVIIAYNMVVALSFCVFASVAFAAITVDHETNINADFESKNKALLTKHIYSLSSTVDAKDRYTSGHSARVAEYSRRIAERMNLDKDVVEKVYHAGLLHDVGKIRIPDAIINKDGKLTDDEYAFIKLHPTVGYHVLKNVYGSSLITQGARYHHERYDGRGYPNGLAGESIPLVGRIIGVADAYDAMTSNRSYRSVMPQDKVRAEIERCKGTQFDPEIADIMIQMIDEDINYQMCQRTEEKYKVIIVDDDMEENKRMSGLLEEEPLFDVRSLENGYAAIKYLQKNDVDLLIMDTQMSEMDGFETYERIRKFSKVPVIFMVTNREQELIDKLEQYSETDYFVKPISIDVLKEIAHCLLGDKNI